MKKLFITSNCHATSVNYSGRKSAVVLKEGSGQDAKFVIIPSISNYKFTDSANVINWAVFGDIYKRKMAATKDWSGTLDGKVDFAAEAGQLTLMKNSLNLAKTEVYFFFELIKTAETGAPDLTKSTFAYGEIIINTFDFTVDAEDIAALSVSFEGNGALTYVIKGDEIESDFDVADTEIV